MFFLIASNWSFDEDKALDDLYLYFTISRPNPVYFCHYEAVGMVLRL